MNIKFNTKDSKITEHGIQTMENKINLRFKRLFANKSEDDATTFYVKVVDEKNQYKVELTLPYMGYQLRAETYDRISAIAALDKAMDTMERQIRKVKTKLSRVKNQVPEFKDVAPINDDAEPSNYDVVRIKSYEMKPTSVQEAVMNMNLLGHTFYTFLNRETNKISTVYKRRDGDYGLIEPQ